MVNPFNVDKRNERCLSFDENDFFTCFFNQVTIQDIDQ
jgi:hypothetical protein